MAEFGHIAFERRYLVAHRDNGTLNTSKCARSFRDGTKRIVREVAANLSHDELRTRRP
jgi:hypothetical protein